MIVQIDAEPDRITMGGAGDILMQFLRRQPGKAVYFLRIGGNRTCILAAKDVYDLVFGHAIADRCAVAGCEEERQRARYAHFFDQSAPCRSDSRLARPRMAAARVGPQTAGVVFGDAPFLKKKSPAGIAKLH